MIDSLTAYLETAKNIRRKAGLVWYRGIDSCTWSIQPGFCWRRLEQEYSLVTEFVAMAPQYLDSAAIPQGAELDVLWQWYFMMQHYGLPTRLLDWTENPLVALYFAVQGAGQGSAAGPPCVWALDPTALNRATVDDEHVIVPGGRFSRFWLPQQGGTDPERCDPGRPQDFIHDDRRSYSNERPLAISPPRRNRRIIAQAGVFTVHGTSPVGLEEILPVSTEVRGVARGLVRIEIDPACAAELLDDLIHLGINRLALFPELPNVAAHIALTNGVGAAAPAPAVTAKRAAPGRKRAEKSPAKKEPARKIAKKKRARRVR